MEAYHNGEGTSEELADRFRVGRATVDRWLYTGRVDPASEPFPGHVRAGAAQRRTASVVTEARWSQAA